MKDRLLLWYRWAYMQLRNKYLRKVKHTSSNMRSIACWIGCAGTKAVLHSNGLTVSDGSPQAPVTKWGSAKSCIPIL